MTGHVTFLRVKALQDGEGRFIEGYATTPRLDRMGDVVVPEGAVFSLPLPLLHAHDHSAAIGAVVKAEVTKAGIRIRAKLTEGVARAEEVWRLVMDGALSAVSIGFLPLKQTPLATGGMRFDSWEWTELSVVAVPAQPDARISVAKCAAYSSGDAANVQASAPDAAWLRSIEPQRPGETEQEAYYRSFDAALTLLPQHLRSLTHVTRGEWLADGRLKLSDAGMRPLATVDLRSKRVQLPGESTPKPEGRTESGIADQVLAILVERLFELDGAVAEGITALAARIKSLEGEAAAGIRYRGYWRKGLMAKAGDAYSHAGSLWWAATETDETPAHESLDWKLLARKGRDAQ